MKGLSGARIWSIFGGGVFFIAMIIKSVMQQTRGAEVFFFSMFLTEIQYYFMNAKNISLILLFVKSMILYCF